MVTCARTGCVPTEALSISALSSIRGLDAIGEAVADFPLAKALDGIGFFGRGARGLDGGDVIIRAGDGGGHGSVLVRPRGMRAFDGVGGRGGVSVGLAAAAKEDGGARGRHAVQKIMNR